MTTVTQMHHVQQQTPQGPPPVEWSSDYTARTVGKIAGDVATIKRWVTFFGVCFVIWLGLSALMVMAMIGAISEASSS